jgi:hypothetical protein
MTMEWKLAGSLKHKILNIHLRCDIAQRNPFSQKNSMIVYIYRVTSVIQNILSLISNMMLF